MLRFLPDEQDWLHLDKHWICDVMYTLDTDGVQHMITDAMKVRQERLEEKRDLVVQMRPEFVEALNSCLNFSRKLGIPIFYCR
jgi:hypothetical protein